MTETNNPVEPKQEEEPQLNGLLVVKFEDNGTIHTDIQIVGDVRATEVQTLLELGVQGWRQKLKLA